MDERQKERSPRRSKNKRPDLEYQRLSETADRLIDVWRSQFPGETREGGLLRSESCQRARENFLKQQPPPPGSDWEAVVRRGAKTWTKEHPFLCATLAATADFGTVAGAAVMVIDLAHGGLGAVVLHHAAAAAGAGAAVTLAVKLFEYLHLVEVQAAAHEKWTQQRAAELAEHIEQNFAKPLFLGLWQEAWKPCRMRRLRNARRPVKCSPGFLRNFPTPNDRTDSRTPD